MTISPRSPSPPSLPPRRVALRRPTVAIGGAALALSLAWAGATSWYIVFRDEIAQSFLARQAELRFSYEDRVADLRTRLEREITQNLVERNGFSARVDAIALRQAEIESRQARLAGLANRIARGGDLPVPLPESPLAPARPEVTGSIGAAKPAPLDDSFGLRLERDAKPPPPEAPRDRLSSVEQSLGRIADADMAMLGILHRSASARAARIRTILAGTGIDLRRIHPAEPAVGGPLVPLPADTRPGAFASLSAEIELGVSELDGWTDAVRTMPFGRPLAGTLEPTSPFGYRLDPFTRSPALHTGEDFRAEYGSLVRATAPGRVVSAEYAGGYGNMIEVDHGDGLVTRYGHLSGYLVAPGTRVAAGQAIGRVGSTGRSTGSHLHYETRINGEPVNPERFLQAGRLLALNGPGEAP